MCHISRHIGLDKMSSRILKQNPPIAGYGAPQLPWPSGALRCCPCGAQHGQPECHQAEPRRRGGSMENCLKHHHGPEHFAPFHLVERLFDLIEGNSLRYEPLEVESAL